MPKLLSCSWTELALRYTSATMHKINRINVISMTTALRRKRFNSRKSRFSQ